jgi:CspA family cold shock protein
MTGTVKSFHPASGHGWLTPDTGGLDVLFAKSALVSQVKPGDRVSYSLGTVRRTGKVERWRAERVEVIQ